MIQKLFRCLLLALAVVTASGQVWAAKLKCDFQSGSGKYAGKWDSGYFYHNTSANTVEVERYQLFIQQTVRLKLNK